MARCVAAVLEAPGALALHEFPIPEIGPEEALLKIELATVCASDPKTFHGKLAIYRLPIILGHEILGRLAVVGEAVAERTGLRVGDRVTVESAIKCGKCRYCQAGAAKFCLNKRGYGGATAADVPPYLWGAFAEYMYVAPNSSMFRIADHVPVEAAALANAVIANGIQWVQVAGGASIGQTVVIQGVGPQGLAGVIAARESGAHQIIATGLARDHERFELARQYGATHCIDVGEEDPVARVRQLTDHLGADVVLDVTGRPEAVVKSIELVRKGGTVVSAGVTGSTTTTPVLLDRLLFNEIRLQGVYTNSPASTEAAIKLIESGKYPIEKMVTHKFPLAEAERALQAVGGESPDLYPIKAALVV